MGKTIQDLWYGRLFPHETNFMTNEQARKLFRKSSEIEAKLRETLSEQGNALFEEYENLSLDMATLSQAEAFEIGFGLGVRLLCDVMSKDFTPSER